MFACTWEPEIFWRMHAVPRASIFRFTKSTTCVHTWNFSALPSHSFSEPGPPVHFENSHLSPFPSAIGGGCQASDKIVSSVARIVSWFLAPASSTSVRFSVWIKRTTFLHRCIRPEERSPQRACSPVANSRARFFFLGRVSRCFPGKRRRAELYTLVPKTPRAALSCGCSISHLSWLGFFLKWPSHEHHFSAGAHPRKNTT